MKQTLFTLLVFSIIIGLSSCKKDKNMPGIKEYDNQQILNYISANGITGMQRDTVGGDTTGIYYKIIQQGTGPQFSYPDSVTFSYTLRSFDGAYSAQDTVTHIFDAPLGHVSPNGLMLALHDAAKYKGTKIRILVPSHLGYGIDGSGSGSKTITNGHIAGNQCLDYTIYLIPDQVAYDDMVLTNYIKANGLTGYTKLTTGEAAGMYYKITVPPTGPNIININSSISAYYTAQMMDNAFVDNGSAPTPVPPATITAPATFPDLSTVTPGAREGFLLLGHGGGSFSLLVPSRLAYGAVSNTGNTTAGTVTVPPNSCLRFEFQVTGVTNPN